MEDNNLITEPAGLRAPIIDLSRAPGERQAWNRPKALVYLWALCELLFVTNAFQISSALRVKTLRLFGATIGTGVIFRPRTRVKFPWNLRVGDNSWIGEGVWIHNQDVVTIGSNVVLSQESFITTGSHAHRKNMALVTKPVTIEDGVWITSRSIILGGCEIGRSALVTPQSVVKGRVPSNAVMQGNPAICVGNRFDLDGHEQL